AMPLYFLLSAVLVAVDQVVKYFVRLKISLFTMVDFLPGLSLTYVQNTGAAFSLLSDHTWLLTLLSAVVSVGLVVALGKRALPRRRGML
ncbi:signal peptidase II, partial [Acinetobacter sp. 163]|nr:signal peptidase II [Acinetobacter sp. 163]